MIAACPQCKTRYRVDRERLGPEGLRLRCNRCQAVFRVRLPGATPAPRAAEPTPEPVKDRQRLVLVADPDAERAKAIAGSLERAGLSTLVCHDGVEAILTLQRSLPRAAILDAALPSMSGFQICELVKRNESLRSTWLVLVGAMHDDAERRRRPPHDLYGADAHAEHPELASKLLAILRGFGMPVQEASRVAAPAPSAAATPAPSAAAPGGELAAERAKAERLARIIVSDIVLYNEEKFAAALRAGDVVEAMAAELAEGRELFAQRTDARVREGRDFVADELLRVARARGMT